MLVPRFSTDWSVAKLFLVSVWCVFCGDFGESLGMDKWFHPTRYNGCNYLSMLGVTLIHVSKRGHMELCERRCKHRNRRTVMFTKLVAGWNSMMTSLEAFSALLALCAGNSPVTGEFPSQRPVTRSFDVFFGLRLNKQLSKRSKHRWFETPSCSLWRHYNASKWQHPMQPVAKMSSISWPFRFTEGL